MSETKLDKFMPLDLGWIAAASQDWDPADAGPLFWVIIYMWPKGGRVTNDDKKLAKVASITPKAWARIRESVGAFFRVEGDELIQDHLVALYAKNAKTFMSNRNKTSGAANARWDAVRSAKALNNASRNASSNASCIASRDASDPVRAFSCIDLDLNLKGEEGSNASPVPVFEDLYSEIADAIAAYPTIREIPGGGTTQVYIGENAAALAADFLSRNPNYPLKLAAQYTAKTDKRPRNWDNWLTNPPRASVVIAAYEEAMKKRAEARLAREGLSPPPTVRELRSLVHEINSNSGRMAYA